ncbi:MAG: Gfo/Idh/MocA family oxidoreductase [Kiritimatiellota bacterium]|nr:Gfo/Idh/MocA family oxidoreductase [Kiritimatiellota bacterium]
MKTKRKKIRVGVFGALRGTTMISVMSRHPDAELAAICDYSDPALKNCAELAKKNNAKVTCYRDFDKFLNHDLDAIVLANYATEHAPYAVRTLESGRHVCSEVLACQTMAEAVQLVEAVERNRKVYAYAENYCYFRGTLEMRRLYRKGEIGEFLHGEGEYVHDCESIWLTITRGEKNHWRNWVPSTFYCTHSIGPVMTITGTRPTRVTAYETPNINKRRFGCRSADGAVIVCQMSNGATLKALPWGNFKRSPEAIWYAIYGTKGMMETDRWGDIYNRVNIYREGHPKYSRNLNYMPEFPGSSALSRAIGGHGGSDFYTMDYFLAAIRGKPEGRHIIDVYQALDMTFPGTLGYRSIVNGNIPLEVPDLRNKKIRDRYRDDNWCLDPKMAGPGQPTSSSSMGKIKIPDSFYRKQAETYRKQHAKK